MTDHPPEPRARKPANWRAVAAVIAVALAAGIAGALILGDSGTPKHSDPGTAKHATVEPPLALPPTVPAPPLVIDEHPAKEIVPSIEEEPELMTEQPDETPPKRNRTDKGSGTKRE